MVQSFSGIEPTLLSFCGESVLKKIGKRTPHYMLFKAAQRQAKRRGLLRGDALGLTDESYYYYNGAFLPGLKKFAKKVGKITSPITTSISKTFLPPAIVNAVAKLDPTRRGGAKGAATTAEIAKIITAQTVPAAAVSAPSSASVQRDALLKTLTDPKVLGIAGAGVLLLLVMSKKK